MASSEAPMFPLVLSVGPDEPPFEFSSPQAFSAWAANDEALWKNAIPAMRATGSLLKFLEDRVIQAATNMKSAALNPANATDFWHAADFYISRLTLPAESNRGKFLRSRLSTDPFGALGALILWTDMKTDDRVHKSGFPHLAEALDRGLSLVKEFDAHIETPEEGARRLAELAEKINELQERIQAEADSIKGMRGELDRANSDISEALKNAAERIESFPKEIETERSKAQLSLETMLKEISEIGPKAREDAKAAIEAIAQVFRQDQHIKKPVDYWVQKRIRHENEMKPYAIVGAVCASIFLAGLAGISWFFFDFLHDGTFRLWTYGVTVLYVTVGLWLLRIVSRLYFSARHLAEDALEREVMTMGLLSLLADPAAVAAVKDGPISRTVDVLYRPANKGVIEDNAPGLDLNKLASALTEKMRN